MRAGRLRHRVTLMRQGEGRDPLGAPTTDWAEVATVWAEVTGISAREFVASGGEQNQATYQILMRYRRGVDDTMRVEHRPPTGNGEVYEIVSALPDARRTQLTLMCKTVKS
ncbi:head-tail adaptor protein [Salinicola endophyticus]|uniref:Head-tail adaptor protein n=2 Tax=Salinicola endophyticus TaxID=1949083 RepID=A0ABY8FC56_9GAMM|nr:head-tail adaptor protein [Salinicola endophyticus]